MSDAFDDDGPLVTVVMPLYNGAEHVGAAIRSVAGQTERRVEHVVVDDGSTDDGPAIVSAAAAELPRLRMIRQANAGLSAARNTGWRAADPRTRCLLFLDHDDLLRPRAIELLLAALDAAPHAPAAHGRNAAVDRTGDATPLVRGEASVRRTIDAPQRWIVPRSAARRLADDEPSTFAALAYVLFIYTPGQVLIRRSAFDTVAGFDTSMTLAQDYDMWLRLAAIGPLAFVPEVVLDYRQTTDSMSSATHLTRREDLMCRFKAMTASASGEATHVVARQMHRHHELHRALDRLGIARTAVRERTPRAAVAEVPRAGRSALEGALALVPGTSLPRWRLARLRRQLAT